MRYFWEAIKDTQRTVWTYVDVHQQEQPRMCTLSPPLCCRFPPCSLSRSSLTSSHFIQQGRHSKDLQTNNQEGTFCLCFQVGHHRWQTGLLGDAVFSSLCLRVFNIEAPFILNGKLSSGRIFWDTSIPISHRSPSEVLSPLLFFLTSFSYTWATEPYVACWNVIEGLRDEIEECERMKHVWSWQEGRSRTDMWYGRVAYNVRVLCSIFSVVSDLSTEETRYESI